MLGAIPAPAVKDGKHGRVQRTTTQTARALGVCWLVKFDTEATAEGPGGRRVTGRISSQDALTTHTAQENRQHRKRGPARERDFRRSVRSCRSAPCLERLTRGSLGVLRNPPHVIRARSASDDCTTRHRVDPRAVLQAAGRPWELGQVSIELRRAIPVVRAALNAGRHRQLVPTAFALRIATIIARASRRFSGSMDV